MITIKYKAGDIVNIYRDSKTELQFEGSAKLIKKIESSHTFIIPNEKLYKMQEDTAFDNNGSHIPLSKEDKINNMIYNNMILSLEGVRRSGVLHINYDLESLRERLIAKVNTRDINNYNNLDNYLFKRRLNRHKKSKDYVDFFEKYTNDQIIRFIYQRYFKWINTIWREEKWLVEFIPDQYCIKKKWCLFNTPFRTTRYVRVPIKFFPNEDNQNCDIVKYTTDETGFNSVDKKIRRKIRNNLNYYLNEIKCMDI